MVASRASTDFSLIDIFSSVENKSLYVPSKEAFSQYRKQIKPEFTKDILSAQLSKIGSKTLTWKGLRLLAIDGDQYQLPASESILENGYRGNPLKNNQETHYPKMYVSYVYDVLTGVLGMPAISTKNKEQSRAMDLIEGLGKNSLILYDRLYFTKKLVKKHCEKGVYFLCRLKNGSTQMKELSDFIRSGSGSKIVEIDGHKVLFIRAKNPKTKGDLFFGTNKYDLSEEEASELYCLRWDIEVAYRDLTHTMKLEQWQSKTMSGILQELYTAIWLYNMIKMHGIKVTKGLDKEYKHSCFTSALKYVSDSVKLLLKNKIDKWRQGLYYILDRTREKRERNARSYPRAKKQSPTRYPCQSVSATSAPSFF